MTVSRFLKISRVCSNTSTLSPCSKIIRQSLPWSKVPAIFSSNIISESFCRTRSKGRPICWAMKSIWTSEQGSIIFLKLSSRRLLQRKVKWRLMTASSSSSLLYTSLHFSKTSKFFCLLAYATSFIASTSLPQYFSATAELMRFKESSLYLLIILQKSMNLNAIPA